MCDARLLVNLVRPLQQAPLFLDPFAGSGGLLPPAVACGYRAVSLDIDPQMRLGLAAMGSGHVVGDARRLPLRDGCLDASATELPFSESLDGMLGEIMERLQATLKPGARMAVMCAEGQSDELVEAGGQLGMNCLLETSINRKGTACAVHAWER